MKKVILILLPFLVFFALLLLKSVYPYIVAHLYSCKFKEVTGYWCPGCGNTRFVINFLNGNILKAVRCNYGTAVVIITVFLFYLEQLLKTFGINKKLLPEKLSFWVTVLIIIMVYYIFRNFIPFLDIPSTILTV